MQKPSTRLPAWLRKPINPRDGVHAMKARLRGNKLHTVCEEARCPNIGECFKRGSAAILILGDVCTRRCGFCNVAHGAPKPVDPEEPLRVAEQVRDLKLKHAVITSVTRDDLPDGGAGHFARTIHELRAMVPGTTIEVLTPDFQGREEAIRTVCAAGPDVFNHNLETVERLTSVVRSRASYRGSLAVLAMARGWLPHGRIKSGIMVGLGEADEEVVLTLRHLGEVGCDVVTVGQYLRPNRKALPVARYVDPETFRAYEAMGLKFGIKQLFCGPFVRSSYLADKVSL